MMEDVGFLQRLERLVGEIESCTEPGIRERLLGVLLVVLDFHRHGLAQLMQHLRQGGEAGGAVIDTLCKDDLVSSLLLLHDLHPMDLATRLRQAMDNAAAQWAKAGADVRLVSISPGGMVQLKVVQNGRGSSTLRRSIEQVIYAAAPDAAGVNIEGLPERDNKSGFVPLSALRILSAKGGAPGSA
jgi:hypothetical protein